VANLGRKKTFFETVYSVLYNAITSLIINSSLSLHVHSLKYISARVFVRCFRSGSRKPEYILSCILQIPFFPLQERQQATRARTRRAENSWPGSGAGRSSCRATAGGNSRKNTTGNRNSSSSDRAKNLLPVSSGRRKRSRNDRLFNFNCFMFLVINAFFEICLGRIFLLTGTSITVEYGQIYVHINEYSGSRYWVVTNVKQGVSGRWQMIGNGFGPELGFLNGLWGLGTE
jgi:hypothetical protein